MIPEPTSSSNKYFKSSNLHRGSYYKKNRVYIYEEAVGKHRQYLKKEPDNRKVFLYLCMYKD